MLSIALATLRSRAGGFIGAFVALFCAAALVAGCGMLLDTGLRGHVSPQRYADAPLVVGADQSLHFTKHKHGKTKIKTKPATETVHLPMSEISRVRSVPEVASAVPEATFPATLLGEPDTDESWGHGWGSAQLTPFTIAVGQAPSAADEVVLDASMDSAVGERVTIQTPESAAEYTVVGVTAQALPGQRAIFFTDEVADRLADHRLSAIGVWSAKDTDPNTLQRALEETSDGVQAYSGDGRATIEFGGAARAQVGLISMSAVLGGTALLVAILVVVGTFALSLEQRHREIALLRAVGATPRQLRRMLGREALLLGVVAASLGSAAGLPLAHWLHGRFVAYGTIPERLHLVTSPLPPLAAVLVTLAAGLLAAQVTARRASRGPAAAALTSVESSHRSLPSRLAGGLLLAASVGGMVLLRVLHTEPAAMPVSMLTAVVAAAGLALLGPIIGRVAAVVAATPLRLLSRTAGYLAAENIRANTRRMAAVIAPITLAVTMAATVLFVGTTISGTSHRQAEEGTTAAYSLRSTGAGVPVDVAQAARKTPGVTAVTQVLHSTVWVGKSRYAAQGVTPERLDTTLDLAVADGSIADLGQHAVALSTTAASGLGLHVGDTLDMRLGDGTPARLRVAATYSRGLGFGDLTLPYDLLATHVDIPMARTVLVAAPASAESALGDLADAHPGTQISNRPSLAVQGMSTGDATVRYIALGLIVGFAAISVVNTLAIATVDRAREFALLGRLGATRRQILRMLRAETLAALATALLLGLLLSAGILSGFAAGMTGTAVPIVSASGCAAIVAAATLLAYLGTAIPTRIMLRASRRPN